MVAHLDQGTPLGAERALNVARLRVGARHEGKLPVLVDEGQDRKHAKRGLVRRLQPIFQGERFRKHLFD